MNKRTGILAIVIILLVAVVLFRKTPEARSIRITMPEMPRTAPVVPHESEPTAKETAPPSSAPGVAQAEKIDSSTPVAEKIKAMRLTTLQEYREDNKTDPHRPSARLLRSVLALDDLRDSVKSESEARQVVGYYKTCLQSDAPASLKVTCYRFSRELAKAYPGVAGEVAALDGGLNADVRRILERTKRE
jgi:hypothetical protein